MEKPKFSQLLRAAANGYLEPYGMGNQQAQHYGQQDNGCSMGQVFDSSDYQNAKSVAAAFNAMAAVFEKCEMAEADVQKPAQFKSDTMGRPY